MSYTAEDGKRPRDGAPGSTAKRAAPRADDHFYAADDDGGGGEAAAYETAAMLLAERRKEQAARDQGQHKGAGAMLKKTETERREDAWRLRQMQAAAGGDLSLDGGDGDTFTAGGFGASAGPVRAVDLRVNRELLNEFIGGGADGQPVILSRQQKLVVPLKDPKSDFAELAKKGSQVLRDMRRRQNERREVVNAVEKKSALINVVVDGDAPDSMTRAEHDEATRKLHAMRGSGTGGDGGMEADRKRVAKEAAYDLESEVPTPEEFAAIQAQRKRLPVYGCRSELLRYVRENSVVVIAGETGSGKTTQIVQYLLEEGFATGLIGCTQPRRMAAVGVSHRVAREVGCRLGDRVGYAIRLEDVTSKDTKVKFMTDGVLMRELINDRMLRKYSVVVMDEAHERSVNTDVLLGAMKDVLRERMDFKLLVTSATMELEKFARFFGAPIFTIPGRTFPVSMNYERAPAMDYVETAVLKVLEIHAQEPAGDVLVFMTGEDDVEGTCELVRERAEALGEEAAAALVVLPCYSMLPSTQQRAILEPAAEGKRKVIVATNIAETSLTIDGIRYVIDSGYMKCKVFKPSIGMNALTLYPVSRAQANQRAGRAGRTAEGVCYRLYTEHQYVTELIDAPVPEIQRSSVDSVVLLLKSIGVVDLAQFDFLDAPPQQNLEASLCRLWLIRALDDAGRITEDGRRIADFPADPPMARTLLEACKLGCGEEAASVVSVLCSDSRSVFAMPKGREESAKAAREKFYAPDSDHITLLNVFEQYVANGMSRAWADDHMLNHLALKRAADIRVQFVDRLTRDFKLTLGSCDGNKDMVREAFTAGYFANSARRSSMTEYTTLMNGVPCELHPLSAVLNAGIAPDYVIFNELTMTTREYVTVVSAVEPQWLISVSRGLFSTRDDNMMKHHVNLVREQRKAILAAAEEQQRAPQPAAAGDLLQNQVTGGAALSAPGSAPKPRFQPRRKK